MLTTTGFSIDCVAFKTLFLNLFVCRTISQGAVTKYKYQFSSFSKVSFGEYSCQGENLFVKVIIISQVSQVSLFVILPVYSSKTFLFFADYKSVKKVL